MMTVGALDFFLTGDSLAQQYGLYLTLNQFKE